MHIVYVQLNPQVRVYKQAVSLAKTGRYELTLVAYRYHSNLFKGVFDRVIRFHQPPYIGPALNRLAPRLMPWYKGWLANIIRNLKPDIFHTLAEPNWVPRVVMENARAPVVFDAQDFTTLRLHESYVERGEVLSEKFCFENADGIIHKGPDIDFMKAKYRVKAPTLLFQDYCLREAMVQDPLPKLSERDNAIHLVYTGVVSAPPTSLRVYGYNRFADQIRELTAVGIHYHLYPKPFQNADLSEYDQIAASTPLFHFHKGGRPFTDLHREISQYDYGISLHNYEITIVQPILPKTTFGNKLFTYLEAGLPVLVSSNLEYFSQVVRQYNVGLSVDLARLRELPQFLASVDYEALRRSVLEAREELSMERQIHRLEEFYQEVAASRQA
jgi:hypothetical protein